MLHFRKMTAHFVDESEIVKADTQALKPKTEVSISPLKVRLHLDTMNSSLKLRLRHLKPKMSFRQRCPTMMQG
jgi:hypothetical protein